MNNISLNINNTIVKNIKFSKSNLELKNLKYSKNITNLNQSPLAFLGKQQVEGSSTSLIKSTPKNFIRKHKNFFHTSPNSLIKYRYDDSLKYIATDKGIIRFNDNIKAHKLEELNKPIESILINNDKKPFGSIAIPTRLDKSLSTYGLLYCCAISFVDKKHNLQTLLHLCPTVRKENNEDLINFILDKSNPDDLEISVVPGCMEETDKTIRFFMDTLNNKYPNKKVNFYYFPAKNKSIPEYNIESFGNNQTIVVLKEGKLYTTTPENLIVKKTNPKDKLLSAPY